jgi:hypothetical protein
LPTLPPGGGDGGGGAHPAGGRRLAVRRVLEVRPREALVGEADVEQDDPGLLVLDEYALDGGMGACHGDRDGGTGEGPLSRCLGKAWSRASERSDGMESLVDTVWSEGCVVAGATAAGQ